MQQHPTSIDPSNDTPAVPELSIVVPIYNEEGAVSQLHRDLVETLTPLGKSFEIIFVDDGSKDRSLEIMRTLSPLTIIQLRANSGQTAAFSAGFAHASGQIVITLDGDGQNPPSDIPKILEPLEGDEYDVVSGWRKDRKDPLLKKIISRGANLLRHFILSDSIHDSGCSLKAYRSECFEDLQLMGEMHRFIPQLLAWKGFRVTEVPVQHLPRITGRTKYNWRRTVKGFIDMASIAFWKRYANRPLHLFGGLGILSLLLGSTLFLILLYQKFVLGQPLADSSLPLLAALAVIMGLQFFVGGILADIAIKSHYRNRSVYSIKQVIEND